MRFVVHHVRLEPDEDGWNLVVEHDLGTACFNVHYIASDRSLDDQLGEMLVQLRAYWAEGAQLASAKLWNEARS